MSKERFLLAASYSLEKKILYLLVFVMYILVIPFNRVLQVSYALVKSSVNLCVLGRINKCTQRLSKEASSCYVHKFPNIYFNPCA